MAVRASEYIKVLQGWVGMSRAKGTHKPIIDLYNSQKKLPRGYKVTYKDAYCATTLSAAAIKCNATDICPIECSCGEVIEIAKKMGIWIENEKVTPEIGWWVLYDWDDDKDTYPTTDNKGYPEHVGAVEKVIGTELTIIEGNYGGDVKRRTIQINGRFIRGYIAPKYSPEFSIIKPILPIDPVGPVLKYKMGDTVNYKGDVHYTSANATKAKPCKGGIAKVTNIKFGAKHPYHIQAVKGSGATVHGWVDALKVSDVPKITTTYYTKYRGTSDKIDEVFKEVGVPSTYIKDRAGKTWAVRKPVAKANGISNYRATAAQNLKLINLAKEGKLIKV